MKANLWKLKQPIGFCDAGIFDILRPFPVQFWVDVSRHSYSGPSPHEPKFYSFFPEELDETRGENNKRIDFPSTLKKNSIDKKERSEFGVGNFFPFSCSASFRLPNHHHERPAAETEHKKTFLVEKTHFPPRFNYFSLSLFFRGQFSSDFLFNGRREQSFDFRKCHEMKRWEGPRRILFCVKRKVRINSCRQNVWSEVWHEVYIVRKRLNILLGKARLSGHSLIFTDVCFERLFPCVWILMLIFYFLWWQNLYVNQSMHGRLSFKLD